MTRYTDRMDNTVALAAPFEHVKVTVSPVTVWRGNERTSGGLSVGIMDTRRGEGTRCSAAYARAEAEAVIAALDAAEARDD